MLKSLSYIVSRNPLTSYTYASNVPAVSQHTYSSLYKSRHIQQAFTQPLVTTSSGSLIMTTFPSLTDKSLRMSYRIARGEQGVLTFEPYKSALLPLWRFRTPSIARKSSSELWARFLEYDEAGDFVGMDMARKFIQMGMTRAKRYANHKGGRKYAKGENGERGGELVKGEKDAAMREKEEASMVFRAVWERCKAHEGYQRQKEEFLKEQREWDRERKAEAKLEVKVKDEDEG